ncbi:MAG: dTMP kinase [Dongiaceae bacterium]
MSQRVGRFITLEGGEGAGKSTQLRLLAEWLRGQGLQVVQTREPGGSPGAERIRELLVNGGTDRWTPLTETLLHYAARSEHIARTIRPALAAGQWVVSDRFADSTLAYQGFGQGVAASFIEELRRKVAGDVWPDLTIVMDLPVEEGLRRANSRKGGEMRYEKMEIEFHQRLRQGFLEIAQLDSKRCAVIDATADVDQVQAVIRAMVRDRLHVS